MYEFVTLYCVSGILVLHIVDTCSIISKYIMKYKNCKRNAIFKNAPKKTKKPKNSPCQREKLKLVSSSFSKTCKKNNGTRYTLKKEKKGGKRKKKH